jgi:hypothetical protein
MILDKRNEFCDAVSVALTAAATAQNVGDVIDLGLAARDVGNGEPLYLVITVDTEIITAGAAGTISFILASDDSATIATNGTQTIHYESRAFVTDDAAANSAQLNAGGVPVVVALPMEGVTYERYLGVQVRVVTTDTTAGKINAFLTHDPQVWKAYDAPFSA